MSEEESPMPNRRKFLLTVTAALLGMGLVVASVIADELLGVLSKVDVDGKKITVIEKDTDKEIEIKITDETEQVSKKGSAKVDLEKLASQLEKAKEKSKKVSLKVTHEKGVASKIQLQGGMRKKKAE
jgi:hypothetical protein